MGALEASLEEVQDFFGWGKEEVLAAQKGNVGHFHHLDQGLKGAELFLGEGRSQSGSIEFVDNILYTVIGVIDSGELLKSTDAVNEFQSQGIAWMEDLFLQSLHIFSCYFSSLDHWLNQVILNHTEPLFGDFFLLLAFLHELVPDLWGFALGA